MLDSAIFMEDSEEDVNRKIKDAYCVEKEIEGNPVIEYVKYVTFPSLGYLLIKRPEKYGGDL